MKMVINVRNFLMVFTIEKMAQPLNGFVAINGGI
jgi:hypothetical protein